MRKFPAYKQLDAMDCGPTCLRMIAKYYGKSYTLQTLRERCFISREGVSLLGTSEGAESIGFRSIGVRITYDELAQEAPLPCIAHWQQRHFIVVYKIKKDFVYVADPGYGLIKYTKEEFLKGWTSANIEGEKNGMCLLLTPTPEFHKEDQEKIDKSSISFIFSYVKPYKKLILQLLLGMLIGSLLQLVLPFLTQSIVDYGINNQDMDFILLILIAQLTLIIGRVSVEFIRSHILLHISSRINISLISDFLVKLMKLPLGFFDTKLIGDIFQRVADHDRVEAFLAGSSLNIFFSLMNLIIFAIVLAIYSINILIIFFIGSLIYFLWIYLFLKKRRELDFKRFNQLSDEHSNLTQLIMGIHDIKLNNCEKQKRWDWEKIQSKLYKVNLKGLSLSQTQHIGATTINESKNIIITFIAAVSVMDGNMTLGMMLAVQYIIGQLNAPIDNMILFLHNLQDAKMSLERINEIHKKDDEEEPDENRITAFPKHNKSIKIENMSFRYEGPHSDYVIKDMNFDIPEGKVTAIVGASGSGKTTFIKLLLGFYKPTKGKILLDDVNLHNYSSSLWRSKTGVVMQEGFIFSDTIAGNIAISDETIDKEKLLKAVKIANIQDFIESLALRYNTKIGMDGQPLSQGQKQRILIARAVYKNPDFMFFDEATNSLDANNERVIMENLEKFYEGKTVIVVAHRLSTVKNADKIIVLEYGKIIESGNHHELVEKKGAYYNLVKNQLELGN